MVTNASSFSSFNGLCLFLIWMIFTVQQGASARKLASIRDVPDKTGVHGGPSHRAPSATQGGYPYPTGRTGNGGSYPNPTGQNYPSPQTSSSGSQQNCGYVRRCTVSPYGGQSCGYSYVCTSTGGQNCDTYTRCTNGNNCSTYTNCRSSSSPSEECISGTCYTEP